MAAKEVAIYTWYALHILSDPSTWAEMNSHAVALGDWMVYIHHLILTQTVCEVVTVQYPYAIVAQVCGRYGRGTARRAEEAR